jgi:peptide deformylase
LRRTRYSFIVLVSCHRTDGIGLSAPQVGVNVQLMVFNEAGVKGEGQEIVLVNPEVYKFSKRLVVDEEGCLSFPGIYANVLVRIISIPIQVVLLFAVHLPCFKVTVCFICPVLLLAS